jgi:serine/threonine protein kinase
MGSDESKTKYAAIKVEIESSAGTDLHKEFSSMKAIGKHPHIIEYLECAKEINRFFNEEMKVARISYLALEYAPNGNLLDYLNCKEKIEEKWVRYWFRQILAGLKHIKSRGYSHLDIKCENILLDGDLNIKICDFTFSRLNDRRINNYCGSEWYRAPEICREHPFDGEKADVFALAVVLFAYMMRRYPTKQYYNVTDTPEYK